MRESGGAERPGMRLLREALRACPRLCVVPLANASMKWLVRWLRKCLMKSWHLNPSFRPKPSVPSTLRPKSSSRKALPYRCALLAWQNTEVSGRKNIGVAEQHGHHNAERGEEGGGE